MNTKPGVVDSKGTEIIDEEFPFFGGAKVKLAFFQKPYILPDQTYGTSLKLLGVQVIELGGEAGTSGAAAPVDVAKLFGLMALSSVSKRHRRLMMTSNTQSVRMRT